MNLAPTDVCQMLLTGCTCSLINLTWKVIHWHIQVCTTITPSNMLEYSHSFAFCWLRPRNAIPDNAPIQITFICSIVQTGLAKLHYLVESLRQLDNLTLFNNMKPIYSLSTEVFYHLFVVVLGPPIFGLLITWYWQVCCQYWCSLF